MRKSKRKEKDDPMIGFETKMMLPEPRVVVISSIASSLSEKFRREGNSGGNGGSNPTQLTKNQA